MSNNMKIRLMQAIENYSNSNNAKNVEDMAEYLLNVMKEPNEVKSKANGTHRLFAFWKYDKPPYYLGGEIEELLVGDRVAVVGYTGMRFKPIKVVPYNEGTKIYDSLKKLEVSYLEQKKALHDEIRSKAEELLTRVAAVQDGVSIIDTNN